MLDEQLKTSSEELQEDIITSISSLNKIKPIVKTIGTVKDKLYVTRIIKEIIPRIEQNFKPFFMISFVNLSKFLK